MPALPACASALTLFLRVDILELVTDRPTGLCEVIRADEREVEVSSGAMSRIAGVSQGLVGSEGIHLAISTIGPGQASSPHWHVNCESAIYVVKGRGRFLTGPNLETTLDIGPGDFLYVPPESVHQPINDSEEAMELIVARNTPVEIVVEVDPAAASAGC